MKATLVASSSNYAWRHPLVYSAPVDHAANKLIDAIFQHAKLNTAANRLKLVGGKHFYTPSEEYKSYFIRFKLYK